MKDDFEVDKVEMVDFEDLFNGEYERRNKPFVYFINYKLFKDKTIFGYMPHHVIFEFPTFLYNRVNNILNEIRWAWQRVFRGWDDRAVWSVDHWLDNMLPDILSILREDKYGVPGIIFKKDEIDEKGHVSEENHKKAKDRWNRELEKMITGFYSSKKLRDLDYNWKDEKEKADLEKVFNEGMKSFVKYYHWLWD